MQLPSWKILGPSLYSFIEKFGPNYQKSLPKNHVFVLIDLKSIFKGQGTPIFSSLANITFLVVPKKISFIFFKKDGSDMTIRSDVVKFYNAKKDNFWVFWKKIW